MTGLKGTNSRFTSDNQDYDNLKKSLYWFGVIPKCNFLLNEKKIRNNYIQTCLLLIYCATNTVDTYHSCLKTLPSLFFVYRNGI